MSKEKIMILLLKYIKSLCVRAPLIKVVNIHKGDRYDNCPINKKDENESFKKIVKDENH